MNIRSRNLFAGDHRHQIMKRQIMIDQWVATSTEHNLSNWEYEWFILLKYILESVCNRNTEEYEIKAIMA